MERRNVWKEKLRTSKNSTITAEFIFLLKMAVHNAKSYMLERYDSISIHSIDISELDLWNLEFLWILPSRQGEKFHAISDAEEYYSNYDIHLIYYKNFLKDTIRPLIIQVSRFFNYVNEYFSKTIRKNLMDWDTSFGRSRKPLCNVVWKT